MEYVEAKSLVDNAEEEMILCCTCGTAIKPNPTNTCITCLRSRIDITQGISRQLVIYWCKGCSRFLQRQGVWIAAELESPQLLALCLKKIKNLSRIRLVDAGFIWTEPHSKRVKVRLVIQAAISDVIGGGGNDGSGVIEQEISVEFHVQNYMCSDCHKVEAKDYWRAVVQVRQKVEHKKTFLYLEQLILKHRAHSEALRIKSFHDGIDFYFSGKQDARKLVDFIVACVPSRYKASQKLISHDTHSNTYQYKHTFCIEIVPVCKDDILVLPKGLAHHLGGDIGPVCVCNHVSSIVHLVDPATATTIKLQTALYWRYPFQALNTGKKRGLTEYTVLQCDVVEERCGRGGVGVVGGRFTLCDVWVVRSCDLGTSADSQIHTRSHLGKLLKPGDTVMGFDVTNANTNDSNLDRMKKDRVPDVVLVRKVFGAGGGDGLARRKRKRAWKLRRFDNLDEGESSGERNDDDYEEFLEDLEMDEELRQHVDIYRDAKHQVITDDDEDDDDAAPKISLQEMLEDLNIESDEDEGDMDSAM